MTDDFKYPKFVFGNNDKEVV